jgi:hypothetical protein
LKSPWAGRLTDDGQVSGAGLGHGRVDLAHVTAAIRFLDVADVQVPRVVLVVSDADPRVARDDVILNGQDRWSLQVDPGHLFRPMQIKFNLIKFELIKFYLIKFYLIKIWFDLIRRDLIWFD